MVSFLTELPGLLLVALTIAVLIKTFVIQPFYIPSGSMLPTLEIDDRVMVSKLHYRFGDPKPGDIVVFESPYTSQDDESFLQAVAEAILEAVGVANGEEDLIKRVVATEGQTVEIHDNRVFVDGVPIEEPYLMPGSRMQDEAPTTVPSGHVFVMGDNRSASSDSRVFGPIPVSSIVGKAVFRIWPLDRLGTL